MRLTEPLSTPSARIHVAVRGGESRGAQGSSSLCAAPSWAPPGWLSSPEGLVSHFYLLRTSESPPEFRGWRVCFPTTFQSTTVSRFQK